MARLKPARGAKKPAAAKPGAIPCLIIILSGIALLSFLFYLMLKSG